MQSVYGQSVRGWGGVGVWRLVKLLICDTCFSTLEQLQGWSLLRSGERIRTNLLSDLLILISTLMVCAPAIMKRSDRLQHHPASVFLWWTIIRCCFMGLWLWLHLHPHPLLFSIIQQHPRQSLQQHHCVICSKLILLILGLDIVISLRSACVWELNIHPSPTQLRSGLSSSLVLKMNINAWTWGFRCDPLT